MSLIRRSLQTKATQNQPLPVLYNPPPQNRQLFQIVNGRVVGVADNKQNYIEHGYAVNDMIYSIVNLIIDKIKVPEWGVYKVVDEQSLKQYKALCSKGTLYGRDYLDALSLHKKAVEPVAGGSKLHDLLEEPNPQEEWNEYIGNSCAYELLTGDDFTAGQLLTMGANSGMPQQIYCLPAHIVSIIASTTFPAVELGYIIDIHRLTYRPEEVLHSRTWNPLYINEASTLYGMSPLKAALQTILRSNNSVKAGASMFENMGIKGVLYVDDVRFDGDQGFEQAQAVKALITGKEYSGAEAAGKIATSGYKVGWQEIGLSPVDLAIIESEKWDYHKFCNVFRVPPELMGLTQKTYNNAKEAEAALTTRVTMPRLNRKRNALNRKFHKDWGVKDKRIIVDYDPSVFTELRMTAKEVVDFTSQLLMITPNEQRTMASMDARTEPEADKVMVKTGTHQFLEDYQANIVDDELNNDPGDDEVPDP